MPLSPPGWVLCSLEEQAKALRKGQVASPGWMQGYRRAESVQVTQVCTGARKSGLPSHPSLCPGESSPQKACDAGPARTPSFLREALDPQPEAPHTHPIPGDTPHSKPKLKHIYQRPGLASGARMDPLLLSAARTQAPGMVE